MKTITILGSTGSIGVNTIQLIEQLNADFKVKALTANENAELLAKQAKKLKPEFVAIKEDSKYQQLKFLLRDEQIEIGVGEKAIIEAASLKSDIVISAIIGIAGLLPTYYAIRNGNNIGLANKESIVCAGKMLTTLATKKNVKIIPIDSEHSAIFQLFDYDQPELVEKIILTASGGPFRNFTKEQLKEVTIEQALNHPNWSMGKKITIDSATMMNKALEIIEAYHLFPIKLNQIEVIVHPESIIHGMVSYIDGATVAKLSYPDMKIPISLALSWPRRFKIGVKNLDLSEISTLTFEKPDYEKFPAIELAKQVLASDIEKSIIFNAANEIAVNKFLNNKIKFLDIVPFIVNALENFDNKKVTNIEDVIDLNNFIRSKIA